MIEQYDIDQDNKATGDNKPRKTGIEVKVRTLWQGMVAVRDKYITYCFNAKRDLIIKHKRDTMIIPHQDLYSRAEKFHVRVFDVYKSQSHNLYYYKWQPFSTQTSFLK